MQPCGVIPMKKFNGGVMTGLEWGLICRISKEEDRLNKPMTDQEKAKQAEIERLRAVYKINKKLGYHATVYVDPDNNARRHASAYLSKLMPTTKCAARDGNPIATIFRGANAVETVTDYAKADLKRYEAM